MPDTGRWCLNDYHQSAWWIDSHRSRARSHWFLQLLLGVVTFSTRKAIFESLFSSIFHSPFLFIFCWHFPSAPLISPNYKLKIRRWASVHNQSSEGETKSQRQFLWLSAKGYNGLRSREVPTLPFSLFKCAMVHLSTASWCELPLLKIVNGVKTYKFLI